MPSRLVTRPSVRPPRCRRRVRQNVPALQTQALVLRSVDFSEADRILHLLVPGHGRMTVMAKHARKSQRRFAGNLDFFNHLSVEIARKSGGRMHRLDRAKLIRNFGVIRTDPMRFALGSYLLEMIDRLAPEGGDRTDLGRLFAFTLEALGWIDTRVPDLQSWVWLELRALDALGFRPELRRCVRCSRDIDGDPVDFHVGEGGPLCGACGLRQTGLLRVRQGTLRALDQGLRFDFEQLERLVLPERALREARLLVERFQRFHLGVSLQSERFLEQMLDPRAHAGEGVGV